ncbi:MAG: rRNA maturation RNase YbeY [Marinosulfonomonas sp.]|nr:rRNA maturation RNase YbeY [Marinosulfonomonas sp.]
MTLTAMPELVDTRIEDVRWADLGLKQLSQTACGAALTRLGLDPAAFEISLLGCDDATIAALNSDFRGKPTATNVLSWPSVDRAADTPGKTPEAPKTDPAGRTELGDIAIAFDTCEREANVSETPMHAHVSHLLVHGTLHLLGYDHISNKDAALMEGLEVEILATLGIPDPYCNETNKNDGNTGKD